MSYRIAFKQFVPPIALEGYRAVKRAVQTQPLVEWSWLSSWPDTQMPSGWNHQSIVDAQIRKWPQFCAVLEGSGPLGVAHEAEEPHGNDVGAQNTVLCFAYVLLRASAQRARLSLLDWGCGLGHYARLTRALAPDLQLDYIGKDVAPLVDAARPLHPNAKFFARDEEAFQVRADCVLVSGSLHYSQDWRATLHALANCAIDSLYVARLPTLEHSASYVVVQRPHRWGYATEYHGWFLNRAEFLSFVKSCGFRLEREFLMHEAPTIDGAPEQCAYRGFWFRREAPSQRSQA